MSSSASALSVKKTKEKKVRIRPYAPFQSYTVDGSRINLTFVKGTDTRHLPTIHDEKGKVFSVPANLLTQYQPYINMFHAQSFMAVNLTSTKDNINIWAASFCSKSEKYSRAKGQRTALASALRTAGLSKAVRTTLWDMFNLANPVVPESVVVVEDFRLEFEIL